MYPDPEFCYKPTDTALFFGLQGVGMKKREVVLVVEDDRWVRDLTRDILELFGHTVLASETNNDALSLCRDRADDITMLLLDATDPTAEDIYEKLISVKPDVRVIVTSARGQEPPREGIFRKAKAFLCKPYRMSELMLTIDKVLQSDQAAFPPLQT